MQKKYNNITSNLSDLEKSLSYLASNYALLSKVKNTEELLHYMTQIKQSLTNIINAIEPLNSNIVKQNKSVKQLPQIFNQQRDSK
ncbi:MAG: hypothetical protein HON42_00940 [Alphaproteobacteria bacterium]|jgi:peptidoglycan hydrolase CwlO-like protein|nr:hypothetical protein [Alphaproteobacteria bacterium]MBT5828537.1 hypothetical protein [Alphaproteobacteria bacterium]